MTTYLVVPIVLLLCLYLFVSRSSLREMVFFAIAFLPTLSILLISNTIAFGSPFATGYSAGGFDQNFPSLLNLPNIWEKTGFYLWRADYGLLSLFPVFFLGAIGLTLSAPLKPTERRMLMLLVAVHFLFIVTMEHHGTVGWGMGRFFLPLYPILAFGLPAYFYCAGWQGHIARGLVFSALLYSVIFAVAAAHYGVQGVMEPRLMDAQSACHGRSWRIVPGAILVGNRRGGPGETIFQLFSQVSSATP